MTEKKPSLREILNANLRFIIVLLSFPIMGMIIAAALVLYKRPGNTAIVLGVIFFLMVQYGLMVYFLIKRMESIGKRGEDNNSEAFID